MGEATRAVFWHFAPWLRMLWYALAVASVGVFVYGVCCPIARYRRGRGGQWPPYPWRELPTRLAHGAREVASHATISRRDRVAGWSHRAIFYGFLTLLAGTVILGVDTDFTDPVFGWNYFRGDFYLVYKEVLNLLGTVLVVGLIAMMIRRAVLKPAKLEYLVDRRHYSLGDWMFVVTLLVIALTGFLLEGIRIAMDHPGYGGTQFVGWLAAQALTALPHATLAGLRHGLWWFHGLLAITFVASIPYTKAGHMLAGFLSLSLKDDRAGARLAPIPAELAGEPAGYGTIEDFSPLHLLDLDACTRCGKCHEACPANATGLPLSPRDVILDLHTRRFEEPAAVASDVLWSCMQCNACVEICPVGIEQAPIINQLRRRAVEDGELNPGLQATLQTIHKSGNSFGENRRRRGRWTEALEFKVKDARTEPVDVLWFVGDYASFDPRSQRVTQTIARLFEAAELDFGILYDGERNAGNDVRRIGEEGLFETLAEHNIETISGCEFSRIVTTDPHSLNTLRNEYPTLGGEWTVTHHTGLLLELLESGRLSIAHPLGRRVTYHDPCHLGRLNGEYDAPRQLVESIGCELIEMPRNRDNSFCCGAGGGRIWITDPSGCERPSENRIREALSLGALDYFVVACPKDVTMYEDAIKTSGNADRIELREVSELLAQAISR
jgi:Fe-S oxidoreductase/nitrate reductase gamma subunit